ncbi:hypothetical protein C8Q79DRAFT_918968 [Trametes meyenii]|nr:hypothetical protein C8Q79DRAFT_918968 [Trametes meyenii]
MSSETVTTAEQIIANHAFFFIDNIADWTEATLILYEYCITLDSEIRLIWRRKITGASVIFFINRYLMVVRESITVASFWPISDPVRVTGSLTGLFRCNGLGYMDIILSLLPYFVWNVFSTLRVYAISGRNWLIAAFVAFIMLGPICANLYNAPLLKPDNMPSPYNCSEDNAVTVATHLKLTLISRLSIIVGDATVLVVTWWKTYRLKKAADAARVRTSIVDLLLRDGTVYFATMLVLNVLHIAINFVLQVSFMGDIADVLVSILVSRFIMNLREYDAKDTGQLSHTSSAARDGLGSWHLASPGAVDERTTLAFASGFIESMAAPLEHSIAPLSESGLTEDGLDEKSEVMGDSRDGSGAAMGLDGVSAEGSESKV